MGFFLTYTNFSSFVYFSYTLLQSSFLVLNLETLKHNVTCLFSLGNSIILNLDIFWLVMIILFFWLPPWNCDVLERPPVVLLLKNFPTLWKPKAHYRVHKSPPPVRILSDQSVLSDPVSLEISFNIIHPPMAWYSQWLHSRVFYNIMFL
jgi:hypothetical protein